MLYSPFMPPLATPALATPRPLQTPQLKWHPEFTISDELITFQVEDTLYSVHGYFLFRESRMFRSLIREADEEYKAKVAAERADAHAVESRIYTILQNVTPANIHSSSSKIVSEVESSLHTAMLLPVVVYFIFERAVQSPELCDALAAIACAIVSSIDPPLTVAPGRNSGAFRKPLLCRLQEAFETYFVDAVAGNQSGSPGTITDMSSRNLRLATVGLMAHLFKRGKLATRIILDSLETLLKNGTLHDVEAVYCILSTAGSSLDAYPRSQPFFNLYMKMIENVALEGDDQTKFLAQELISMRDSAWALPSQVTNTPPDTQSQWPFAYSDTRLSIRLSDISCRQFEGILSFFYRGMHLRSIPTPEWIELLSISTRYEFPAIRTRAIIEIEGGGFYQCSLVQRILMAREFDIPSWMKSGLEELCARDEPLSETEAHKLGITTTIKIARAREAIIRSSSRAGYHCSTPPVPPSDFSSRPWSTEVETSDGSYYELDLLRDPESADTNALQDTTFPGHPSPLLPLSEVTQLTSLASPWSWSSDSIIGPPRQTTGYIARHSPSMVSTIVENMFFGEGKDSEEV